MNKLNRNLENAMADDIDLRDLIAGDTDMVARDLRGASLTGADLRARDFSECNFADANLEGADLSGSSVRGAVFFRCKLASAKFDGCNGTGALFADASAIGASFRKVDMGNTNFNNADVRGADFQGAKVKYSSFNQAKVDDMIVDDETDFEGSAASRTLALMPAFRHYLVKQGKLVRRPTEEVAVDGNSVDDEAAYATPRRMFAETGEFRIGTPTISSSHTSEYPEMVAAIDKLLAGLKAMAPPPPAGQAAHGGMGHNGPPDDYPLNRDEHDDLVATLTEVRVELYSGDVRPDVVEAAANKFDSVGWQIAKWVGRKADLAADELAKNIGKNLADYRQWVAGYMIVSGQLANLSQALTTFLGGFTH